MAQTIEEMIQLLVEKLKDRKVDSVRDNNGYTTGGSVRTTIPSTQGTAVAYDLEGSSWNREGLNGGGVSYFQEVRVSNGEKDLVVIPRFQFRSGANYSQGDDYGSPGREEIVGLEDLGNEQYRVATQNHGISNFLVDFRVGRVSELENLSEEVPTYYHGGTSYSCPRHYPSHIDSASNRNNQIWVSETSSFIQEKGYSKNKPQKVKTELTFVRSSSRVTNNMDFDSEIVLVGGERDPEKSQPQELVEFTNFEPDKYLVRVRSPVGERRFVVTTSFHPYTDENNYPPRGENKVKVEELKGGEEK